MATQAATASWLLRDLGARTAAEAAPPAGSYKHPAKGQWNIPGRLAGWEDASKVRFSTNIPAFVGEVTAAELTVLQRLNPDSEPTQVARLVLTGTNGQFEQTSAKPIAPGSYTVYLSRLTVTPPAAGAPTPSIAVRVFLQGLNEDML